MGKLRTQDCTDEVKQLIKDGRKKFVRLEEGAILYSIGKNTLRQLAADAGATYHVKRILLINTKILDEYLEHFKDEMQEEVFYV